MIRDEINYLKGNYKKTEYTNNAEQKTSALKTLLLYTIKLLLKIVYYVFIGLFKVSIAIFIGLLFTPLYIFAGGKTKKKNKIIYF